MRTDPDRFAVFILTHGRADNVVTFPMLRKHGYFGRVFFVVDNEDADLDRYVENFGRERVLAFDKKAYAERADVGNNFDDRRVVVHARNAAFDLAVSIGVTHFVALDDDYLAFKFRYLDGHRLIRDLDRVFATLLEFFEATPTKAIAISQGGDHIGGFSGVRLSRKCMNLWLCSTARRFPFLGWINEDVTTTIRRAELGDLFFTYTGLQLDQTQTQKQKGGLSTVYLERGTYVKSFSSVVYSPSSVSVSMLRGQKLRRIHHAVAWRYAVPKIVPARVVKKNGPNFGGAQENGAHPEDARRKEDTAAVPGESIAGRGER